MKHLEDRVEDLGGNYAVDCTNAVQFLESLSFDRKLILNEEETPWTDYFEDEEYEAIANMEGIISYDNINAKPMLEFEATRFTPFTVGTDSHDEWDGTFDEEQVEQIIETFGDENPEFLIFATSNGWPDTYLINLNEDSDDPTVYTSDHEQFLIECEEFGSLTDFFNCLLTEDEYIEQMEALKLELNESK